MSEGNSPNGGAGVFAKRVQRQLSRGKEKVLQKLGKTVETKDEQFEHCIQNLTDQQSDGSRLYKDLKVYLNSVREMREASKRLSMSLFDVYEPDWDGDEDLGGIVEAEDLLWNDYEGKLLDQSLHTMESYMSQFPDVRERVAKRGRKLIDYDSSRHHLEALQNAKKRDDIKISKAEVEVNRAQSVFEGINTELRDELPALYDSRIGCYVSVFTAISNLRDIFYKEMGKLNHDLQNVMKELQAQHPDKVFVVKGLQRTGSLKRRSLMSPRSWKASFSDVHTSYSPKHSLPSREHRSSFRSSDRPRLDESCTSTPVITPRSLSLDDPSSEAIDVDADFTRSDDPIAEGKPKSDMDDTTARASGADPKSGEEGEKLGEEEKDMKDGEPEPSSDQHSTSSDKNGDGDGDGESSALIESTSQVTNSHDSESLELQPSATDNTPMTLEETLESPEVLAPNGVQNGEASDSFDPPDTDGIVQKGAPLEKQVSENVRTTVV